MHAAIRIPFPLGAASIWRSFEAMSMLLLETASLETPIVCSDIPDNRAVLGADALYFAPGDVDQLLRQMERVAADPAAAAEVARRAATRVRRQFSCEVVTARYAALYRRAHNGTNKRHHPGG